MIDVLVIGGGAAGLMAAGFSAQSGAKTLVLDKNEKIGKKLYITGKGRCNLTNNCAPKDFLENVVSNGKFLYGALNVFPPSETVALLSRYNLETKTERGGRVFPLSDKSSDVIKALNLFVLDAGAEIKLDTNVLSIKKSGDVFETKTAHGTFCSSKLILACGGKSYPATGSDGGGYVLAASLGHRIVPCAPALVPIKLSTSVKALEGLSLKNVSVTAEGEGFKFERFGEMLFTSDGATGPIILSLSSLINRKNLKNAELKIDLKPALNKETLDLRILSDFKKYANKQIKNALDDLLPKSMIPYIISYCGFDPEKPINIFSKDERLRLLCALKELKFKINQLYPVECGIVTAGGVDISEVSPKTLESKLVKNLFFAGEMLDVDAFTGGYNIQIAFSTGALAGSWAGRS